MEKSHTNYKTLPRTPQETARAIIQNWNIGKIWKIGEIEKIKQLAKQVSAPRPRPALYAPSRSPGAGRPSAAAAAAPASKEASGLRSLMGRLWQPAIGDQKYFYMFSIRPVWFCRLVHFSRIFYNSYISPMFPICMLFTNVSDSFRCFRTSDAIAFPIPSFCFEGSRARGGRFWREGS